MGCAIKRCRGEAAVIYLGKEVCEKHWNLYQHEDAPEGRLREVLGLSPAHHRTEESTMSNENSTPTPAAETTATTKETTMPKAKKTKAPKKSAAKKSAPKKKAAPKSKAPAKKAAASSEPKPKREDLVVFAFRLPEEQRDIIHKAAGPGKASRFVIAAALAAATDDHRAFKELVEGRAAKIF